MQSLVAFALVYGLLQVNAVPQHWARLPRPNGAPPRNAPLRDSMTLVWMLSRPSSAWRA
jgi:hypothetical protein